MEVSIRQAQEGEQLAAYEIWKQSTAHTHTFLAKADEAEIDKTVRKWIQLVKIWFSVGENDNILGFMVFDNHRLEALFVKPEYFGMGVGRQMVEYVISVYPALTVDVNEQNTKAFNFYQKMGFKVDRRSPTDSDGRPYPLLHMRYHPQ